MIIRYNEIVLARTLDFLKQSGFRHMECVVLWLGKKSGNSIDITNVYRPAHKAAMDYFHIPRESMNDLTRFLRENRLVIGAQVHSHPSEAFHSQADDKWAVIRHMGAISIVIPDFALHTTPHNFMDHAATFSLNPNNRWIKLSNSEVRSTCLQTN